MELALNLAATAATIVAMTPWWVRVLAHRQYGDRASAVTGNLMIVAGLTLFTLGGIWL